MKKSHATRAKRPIGCYTYRPRIVRKIATPSEKWLKQTPRIGAVF